MWTETQVRHGGRTPLRGLVVAVALCSACDPSPKADPVVAPIAEELPRYWLQATTLLASPGGKQTHQVHGPVLVELGPDGRVRSLPGAEHPFEGYLPETLLFLPGEYGHGLLLYAQRETELRVDRPSGPRAGLLHPGAFVTVAPGDDTHALIGLPEFVEHDQPMVAFVERSALGATPVELVPKRNEKGKTVLGYSFQLRLGKGDRSVSTLNCRDVLLHFDSVSASQYVAGVEIRGATVDSGSFDYAPSRPYLSLLCPANTVFRIGSELRLPGLLDKGAPKSVVIEKAPQGYRQVTLPDPDPLAVAIEQGASIWWLVEEQSFAGRVGVWCERWTFDRSARGGDALEGRLVGPRPLREPLAERDVVPYYPFSYRRSSGTAPARLHLEHIVPNLWRCLCDFDYALLGAIGDELHVMGRPITEPPVAYDPGEAERWFLTRSACEAVRDEAVAELERDPAQATRIGFRAGPQPYNP